MIVYEGYGNILTHNAQTLTVPVNCVGIMGKGLALTFKNRVMGLNDYYKKQCEDSNLYPGKLLIYKDPVKTDKQILLFPTKDHWRNPSELKYIKDGLEYLVTNLQELNINSLALPALGCGLGNLDYTKQVKPLFHQYLNNVNIDSYILLRDSF